MNYDTGKISGDPRLIFSGDALAEQPRRGWWIALAALAAVLVAAVGVWMFVKPAAPAPANGGKQIPSVTVMIPGRQLVDRQITTTGSLAARVDMPVGVAGEGGLINAVLVEPGQWVRAGQVLATIDRSVQDQAAASLAAQINVSRADAQLAQAELDRARQLVDRGFISKADVDRRTATRDAANARVRVAQAQLAEAQARTARLAIRAPAAGLVLTRAVEPGQIVSAGSGTLFRLARGGEFELRALLSEGDLAQLRVGISATVVPVGGNRPFTGHIWQISPTIDPQSRQGIARIALRYDPALRPGGFASATLISGSSEAPLLPQSAVQSDDQGNFVYIVNPRGEVVRVPIKVGQVSDAGVAIVSGLTGRERVVVSAGPFLSPGQKVVPVRAKVQG